MQTTRKRLRSVFLSLLLAIPASSAWHNPAQAHERLHVQWTSNRVLNAVAVADNERTFVSFPYWGGGGSGPTVAEIDANGQPHAFPDVRWNHPDETKDDLRPFVRVNALRIGPDGLLWVVDSGDANVGGPPGPHSGEPARLLAFDITTGRVVHAISLKAASTPHSYMDDIRFHEDTVFVTDAGDPALVVVDLSTGAQRRVLAHDRSTTDDRPMYAEGHMLVAHGQQVRIHADQLEVSPDGRKLYFQPSSGPMWVVPTAALENPDLPAADLSRAVTLFYGNRPLWAALIMRPVCAVYSRVSSSMATVRGAG
nr:L-dopachrome tautomerase-related protein [Komagataeibacter swingsii]